MSSPDQQSTAQHRPIEALQIDAERCKPGIRVHCTNPSISEHVQAFSWGRSEETQGRQPRPSSCSVGNQEPEIGQEGAQPDQERLGLTLGQWSQAGQEHAQAHGHWPPITT